MNASERIALEWLLGQGYEAADLRFRANDTPDFVTAAGEGFEVKLLYGNSIRFTGGQVEKLSAFAKARVIIVKEGKVAEAVCAKAFQGKPARVGTYSVSYMEASSNIKVPGRVADKSAELQHHIERYGWGSLDPELQRFFREGLTHASVFEAALWLLEKQLCPKKEGGDAFDHQG